MVNNSTDKQLNSSGDKRGLHPNSLRNLENGRKSWQKGESGNPSGRPKDPGITPGQIKLLDELCPFDGQGRSWRIYLEEKGLLQIAQSPRAMHDFKDRVEGPVPQTVKAEVEAEVVHTFNFILPDGSKFKADQFAKGNGNGN